MVITLVINIVAWIASAFFFAIHVVYGCLGHCRTQKHSCAQTRADASARALVDGCWCECASVAWGVCRSL